MVKKNEIDVIKKSVQELRKANDRIGIETLKHRCGYCNNFMDENAPTDMIFPILDWDVSPWAGLFFPMTIDGVTLTAFVALKNSDTWKEGHKVIMLLCSEECKEKAMELIKKQVEMNNSFYKNVEELK